jgi:aminoglycoside/choline kinase family phosphotransferase
MIVKLPSPNPAAAAIMRASGGYRTEVRFYQQAGAAIGLRVPACYGAFFDDTTSNFLLLLEDLAQHRNADRAGGLSPREITAVVTGLATSHAQWWRNERLATFDWLPPIAADAAWVLAQFPGSWPIVTDRLGTALPPGIGDRIARLLRPMYDRLGRQPVTILHLDVRRENLFFTGPDDDPEPILIDWQSMRAGRGPAALASFLASLPGRAKVEAELVSLYHSRLMAIGVCDYTVDECLDDYRLGLRRRFIHPACILASVDPDSAQGRNILALLSTFGLERLEQYVDRLEAHQR